MISTDDLFQKLKGHLLNTVSGTRHNRLGRRNTIAHAEKVDGADIAIYLEISPLQC